MKTADKPEELRPADGGINCVVAEHFASDHVNFVTKGKGTRNAIERLQMDVGAAVMAMAMAETTGTLEIQLTVKAEVSEAPNPGTNHIWRVDVWKARQRQYLRVPVVSLKAQMPDEIGLLKTMEGPPNFAKDGSQIGAFKCTHCGERNSRPGFWLGKLPHKTAVNCTRCTLPIFLQLVDIAGEQKPKK